MLAGRLVCGLGAAAGAAWLAAGRDVARVEISCWAWCGLSCGRRLANVGRSYAAAVSPAAPVCASPFYRSDACLDHCGAEASGVRAYGWTHLQMRIEISLSSQVRLDLLDLLELLELLLWSHTCRHARQSLTVFLTIGSPSSGNKTRSA